ncbi:BTAD domain-containing putative transcriptional regulator [Pseudonocardia sp.]|uniref:BTAD domain-containing putative transcriptional regulator n=1 Tax=Pseudonocardia sp. TaxID=60912 RepID=UPI003D135DD5
MCASTALALLVVGPPWALSHLVGSPLPRQAPSPAELLAVLTRTPDSALVLAVLAGVCWLAWAAFVLDVLLAAVTALAAVADLATARRRSRDRAPLPRTARWRPGAVLVGLVLLAVVGGYRPTPATGSVPVGLERPLAPPHTAAQTAAHTVAHGGWVDVRGPAGGVHDSLWRIADRELGDPTRWPELFERNAGRTQPDGRALTTPELIQPGWRLALPAETTLPDPPHSAPRRDPSAGPSDRDPGPVASDPDSSSPAPSSPARPDVRWLDVGPGVVLGISFGTVVAALLAAAHRRRGNRRAATAGADEFLVLPVVREIARRATPPAPQEADEPHVELTGHAPPEPHSTPDRPDRAGGPDRPGAQTTDTPHPWTPPFTVARSGNGLGLAGPGSQPALRALLLELLMAPGGGPPVIVGDLAAQLGLAADDLVALGTHLVGTLNQADSAAASLIDTEDESRERSAPVVLAAAPPDDSAGSIAALVAGGALPVLLGSWAGGATAYVRADGTIAAAGPTANADLVACRLPVLDVVAATELIELSTRARAGEQSEPAARPAPPVRPDDEQREPTTPPRTGTDLDPVRGRTRPARVWTLAVLGRPSLHVEPPDGVLTDVDVVSTLTPRMICLLVFLALHPHGVRRDTAVAALWPDSGRGRPGNNLSSLISRLRSALRSAHPAAAAAGAQMVLVDGDRYRLDPDHVWVDYWDFLAAGDPPPRQENDDDGGGLADLRAAHDLYRGPLGEGIDDEWILSVREAARRNFLAITAQLVRGHVDSDPAEARRILETARNLEPTNQAIYRDIIALQLKSGDNSGAAATMRLLGSQLADLDELPDDSTRILAQQIEHGPAGDPKGSTSPEGASRQRASLAARAPGQPPRPDRG